MLALTSGAQPHELLLVDLSCSLKREGSWEFTLPTDIKTSRPGHLAHKFCFIPSFPGYYQETLDDASVAVALDPTLIKAIELGKLIDKLSQGN